MNYLYNGVKLPEFPEWNNPDYPFLTLRYSDGLYDRKPYYGLVASREHYAYDSKRGAYVMDSPPFYWTALNDGVWNAWAESTSGASYINKSDYPVWTNYDLTLNGGSVMKASDPILADTGCNALTQGWIVGKRLAAMRGKGGEA